jgi:hypothetical protein
MSRSSRNGGFALRGGAARYDVARETCGAEAAQELWRRAEAALDRLEAIAGDAFRRTGSLRLVADDEERDEIRLEYEALSEGWIRRGAAGRVAASASPARLLVSG